MTFVAGGGTGNAPSQGDISNAEYMEEWQKFLNAEGIQESGNNYGARNANSGALGRWQVMPDNICPWARETGLACESADYFLTHPSYQLAIVTHILGGYFDTYGPAGAAAMWYSGQPNPDVYYGDPSVHDYVDDVLALMNYPLLSGAAGASVPSDTGFPSPPAPDTTDSWYNQVHESGVKMVHSAQWAHAISADIHNVIT